MDELGRVIANLMNSMPGGGTDGAEPSAPPDGRPSRLPPRGWMPRKPAPE